MDGLVEKTYIKWLEWAMDQKWCRNLTPVHTSGCPAVKGEKYSSDVDVNVLVTRSMLDQLVLLFEKGGLRTKSHIDQGWITVSFPGYELEVNARFTVNKEQLVRTLTHRLNETLLAETYPKMAEKVAELKLNSDGSKGMSTEPAWSTILEFKGSKDDAYEYLASPLEKLLEDAEKLNKI